MARWRELDCLAEEMMDQSAQCFHEASIVPGVDLVIPPEPWVPWGPASSSFSWHVCHLGKLSLAPPKSIAAGERQRASRWYDYPANVALVPEQQRVQTPRRGCDVTMAFSCPEYLVVELSRPGRCSACASTPQPISDSGASSAIFFRNRDGHP